MKKGKANVSFIIGLVLVALVFLLCVLSFVALPYDSEEINTRLRFSPPSAAHILGTDHFGRDIYSRILVSTRSALLVSISSVFIGSICGSAIGSAAALSPRAVETVLMRLTDASMAFPGILSALMLSAVLGKGIANASLAIAFFMVPVFSRLSYSMILESRKKLHVKAARSYGVGGVRLVVVHMLPDIMTRMVTQFSSSIGAAILTESSLSFLGLGVQPPEASLGLMLSDARSWVLLHPYQALWPGVVLTAAIMGFSLLGDGINAMIMGGGDV